MCIIFSKLSPDWLIGKTIFLNYDMAKERKISEKTITKYKLVIDEYLVNGFNGTKAYQKFYPKSSSKTADSKFRILVAIGRISEYLKSKQKDKSDQLNITLEGQLKTLNDIINSKAKDSDKINAIKEQNKLLALYKEHNEQKKTTHQIITGITFKDEPEANIS